MKNIAVIMAFAYTALLSCTTPGPSNIETQAQAQLPGEVGLDAALGDFSAYIGERLPRAGLTAMAVTDAPIQRLGNYIAAQLTSSLLNSAGLRMVSRQDFERIVSEQNLQTAMHFNDDTTAKIGHNLGWQTIIFGAVEALNETYRLTLRAVDVESGELWGTKNYMLSGRDPVLISLVNPDITVQKLAERDTILQPFGGKQNDFELSVSTNKQVFYDSEELFITLYASEDCYFVVYHLDIDNNMQAIYPNSWERDRNFLKAHTPCVIPEGSRFGFVLHAPYGEERILVYASRQPFAITEDQYRRKQITRSLLASPEALWHIESNTESSRGMSIVQRGATAQTSYTILPRG
jgi:hypothetical protein